MLRNYITTPFQKTSSHMIIDDFKYLFYSTTQFTLCGKLFNEKRKRWTCLIAQDILCGKKQYMSGHAKSFLQKYSLHIRQTLGLVIFYKAFQIDILYSYCELFCNGTDFYFNVFKKWYCIIYLWCKAEFSVLLKYLLSDSHERGYFFQDSVITVFLNY